MKKDEVERLVRGEHHEPHRLLGAHTEDGRVVIRAFRPDALYRESRGVPPDLLIYFGDLDWRSVGSCLVISSAGNIAIAVWKPM